MRGFFAATPFLLATTLMFQNCSPGFDALELASSSGRLSLSSESISESQLTGLQNSPYLYNYAPSVISDNGNTYMWTCSNTATPKEFRDVISLYINNQFENIALSYGDRKKDWDGEHACDPSVLRGDFSYDGQSYNYLMAYLGEDWNDANGNGQRDIEEYSMHNQVGVAFAKSITGPWVKHPNPVIAYADRLTWGVGQPSLLKSPSGNILLFYTKGEPFKTSSYWQELDFSRTTRSAGPRVVRGETEITLRGLTSDSIVYIRNVDLVTDSQRKTVYMLRQSERDKNSYVQIVTMSLPSLLSGNGTWSILKDIGSSTTGMTNNHNAGFLRTAEGTLANDDQLSVFVTVDSGTPTRREAPQIEWDYHIVQVSFDIQRPPAPPEEKSCPEQFKQSLTQVLSCAAGESGVVSQSRSATCDINSGAWVYSSWQTTINTCQFVPAPASEEGVVTITSPTEEMMVSSRPTINWSYAGSATELWMDISEFADFRWFWNKRLSASTRSYVYSAEGWGKHGAAPGDAPTQLEGTKRYYLRIAPFKNGSALSQAASRVVMLSVQSEKVAPLVGNGILEIFNPQEMIQERAGQPLLAWGYQGSATDFWIDISENSNFNWFWNKNLRSNYRAIRYDGHQWGSVGAASPPALQSLVSGRKYYLRITPFFNGNAIASESKTVSFTAP